MPHHYWNKKQKTSEQFYKMLYYSQFQKEKSAIVMEFTQRNELIDDQKSI
jgi:hypothetical protein